MIERERVGDVARHAALMRIWRDLASDHHTVRRDPGGREIDLAVRSLQRAARITERQDLAEAAQAALALIDGRVPQLRAVIQGDRTAHIEHELRALHAAAVASVGLELDDRATARNTKESK